MISRTSGSADPSDDPSTDSRSDAESDLSPNDIYHVLQTNRRRLAIDYLLDADGPVKMGDVAEDVAARENGITVAELDSAQRQRVYIPLYQSHLPKLDKLGVIEYDRPRGVVRPTERLAVFRPYLEPPGDDLDGPECEPGRAPGARPGEERGDAWYTAATAAGTGLLFGSATGVLAIPGLAVGAITVALFALVTIASKLAASLPPNDVATTRPAK